MPSTLYYGPMKSGKSLTLIRAYRAHRERDDATFFVFSFGPPFIRTRGEQDDVPAQLLHDDADLVRMAVDVIQALQRGELVICFFDEVQFAPDIFPALVESLSQLGAYVYLAGLDTDFRREPFGPVTELQQRCDHVHPFRSDCDVCGQPAEFTQRLQDGSPVREGDLIVLDNVHGGETSYTYETRCEGCYVF